jgi:putative flippase GtrA
MPPLTARVFDRARSPLGRKALRYSAVSAVGVVTTQTLLLLFYGVADWSGAASNVAAVSIAALPAYLLNRYWVWGKTSRNHFIKEVVPFWGMTLLGLLISTGLVALASDWWESALAVSAANLAGFGTLWVAKFLLLDSLIFKFEHHHDPDAGEQATAAA